MTVNQEFKIAIQTNKYKEAMLMIISQAFQLKITTSVNSSEKSTLSTEIDLVEGKLTNQINPSLLENRSDNLLEQMHLEQVKIAPQLMVEQIQNWQKLLKLLASQTDTESDISPKYQKTITQNPNNEWEEFIDEVEEVEVITPRESPPSEDDWGDWMDEEEENL